MQALQFSATGSLDTLQLHGLAKPVPAAGEVLVEVRTTGVNPSDIKNVLGLFPYTTTPRIPGRDFAGVIVEGPEQLLGQAVWGGAVRVLVFIVMVAMRSMSRCQSTQSRRYPSR